MPWLPLFCSRIDRPSVPAIAGPRCWSQAKGLLLAGLMLVAGCTHDAQRIGLKVSDEHGLAEPRIEFLGVGGWLLHWRGEGLLLAPSFSNPALLGIEGVPPLAVAADTRKIDRYMPEATDVSMLLVGHGHYDHLMDVPRVMQQHAPWARVYGNQTVGHILRAQLPPERIVVPSLDQLSRPGDPAYRGTWFYSSGEQVRDGAAGWPPGHRPVGRIRAMPLHSMHAGHIFRTNLIPGAYAKDLAQLPRHTLDWKPGYPTLAWVIDLLGDDGQPVYRMHYQDSASDPPLGFPPVLADAKAFDVAIICAASRDQVSLYPQALLKVLKPRLVLLGHWENFFGNDPAAAPRTLPLQNPLGLVKDLERQFPGTRVVLPRPLSQVQLPAAQ